ncbi:MAG: YfhO family protein [Crocinitomicaceae bacterium]
MDLKSLLFQKKNLWHVGSIAIFLIITTIYLSPNLSGYTVQQADIVNFVGMSREIQDYRENDGNQIMWTNAMFSGMPSTQISVKYEGNWLAQGLKKVVGLGLPYPMAFLFIYFISFYILGLSLKIKPYISALGAIAFGLSSYFIIIIEAGHNSKAGAIGFIPILIAGFILTYRSKKYILAAGFAAIGMLLELAANHIQITYYASFLLLFLGIVELVKAIKSNDVSNFLKRTVLLILGYGLALLVSYGNIFGTLEYSKQTIRGGSELTITADGNNNTDQINQKGLDKDYVTNWSYGLGETFSFIVPNFKGGETQLLGSDKANRDYIKEAPSQFRKNLSESGNKYWGDQPFTSGPVYIGVIVVFLAFLSLLYVNDKYKWALLSATLLAITLSWGKNFVSVLVLIPILLYLGNLFLEDKKKIFGFNITITGLLLIILFAGNSISEMSLTDFFLEYLPGYNKLRAVTIILALAELCIPVLGILFLNKIIKNKEEINANIKPLLVASSGFLLLMIGFYIAPETFNTFLSNQELGTLNSIEDPQQLAGYEAFFDELVNVRQAIFKADVARSLGFLVVGIGLVFAYLKLNLNKYVLVGALSIFIFADLFTVDNRYLATEKSGKNYAQWTERYKLIFPFKAGDAEKEILKREIALNPSIETKIDSALSNLKTELKESGASSLEKNRQIDFLTYRILNRNTNFRVLELGNSFNSSYVGYFNKSIGGYHGAKLSRYQDLIEFHLSQDNPAVIDMLNTKYMLQTERNRKGEISNTKLVKVNQNAMGNAWLAKEVKIVENANEEIQAMSSSSSYQINSKEKMQVLVDNKSIVSTTISEKQSITILPPGQSEPIPVNVPFQALQDQSLALILDTAGLNWVYDSTPDSLVEKIFTIGADGKSGWDPRETTLIDNRFKDNISHSNYNALGSIEMTNYHPDRITYKFNSNEKELAVFSEMYYRDGWTAYIDKEKVPISRVNYVLRAIEVPAGEHQVEFIYESNSFKQAGILANIGNIGIILLLIGGIYFEFVKQKSEAVRN